MEDREKRALLGTPVVGEVCDIGAQAIQTLAKVCDGDMGRAREMFDEVFDEAFCERSVSNLVDSGYGREEAEAFVSLLRQGVSGTLSTLAGK